MLACEAFFVGWLPRRLEIQEEAILTAESARSIIGQAFPELRRARVELLDEGWDFRVFEVEAMWLFRFPKRESSVLKLKMEQQLLPGLGEWVSLQVPSYEYFCESLEISERPFGGYRKLPGVGADTAGRVDRREVARRLGAFLSELHTYPADEAREAGVPEVRDLVEHWRGRASEELPGLADLLVNLDLLHRYLEREVPAPFEGATSLVHGDLWALHILIDRQSGGLAGIIDWADAIVGDPAIDFACLYTWHGEKWVKNVLSRYAGKQDAGLIPRSRYLATCLAIHCIALGRELGRTQWIEGGLAALQLTRAT